MTTMTSRVQCVLVPQRRTEASPRPASGWATTAERRPGCWTSLRRWHATAPWDELAELREQSFARHEAVERRLFVALR